MLKNFTRNKIFAESNTVGDQLQLARSGAGLTLKKVSKKTKINIKYLSALEKGEYDKLPAGLYERKYVKEYAAFLNLDAKKILEEYDKEKKIVVENKNPGFFSEFRIKKVNFIIFPKIVKGLITILVVGVCFGYIGYCLYDFISSPELTIAAPRDNMITKENTILIAGETEPEVEVYINGNSILTGQNGSFKTNIDLREGVNNIQITAEKKYSRKKVINKQILVKK
jgi:transcriptional regulator with XRE-family HTH domain